MNTSAKLKNIINSIETLSLEDKNLLVQQLQNKEEEDLSNNPWIKLAGKYENDPLYDEVLSYIEEYRHELDTEVKDNS